MPRNVKIQCPLCRIPMEYTLRQSIQNPKAKQVVMYCPKCGNDPKNALKQKFLGHES